MPFAFFQGGLLAGDLEPTGDRIVLHIDIQRLADEGERDDGAALLNEGSTVHLHGFAVDLR